MKATNLCLILLVCSIVLFSTAAAEKQGNAWEQDLEPDDTGLTPADDIDPKGDNDTPNYNQGNNAPDPEPAGRKVLISGVPKYYQTMMSNPAMCFGAEYKTGCGPVTGAAILGWWERRGVSGLMLGGTDANGLPENLIIDLGSGDYMVRLPDCDGSATAVLPDNFKSGLQEYFDDHSSIDFTVTKHKITKNSDFDYLWGIVKTEIESGRPLVYLYRAGGEKKSGGYQFADHYAVVVGYDQNGGKRNLIIQPNWGSGTWSTPYMNTYDESDNHENDTYLDISHYARDEAAINYNLYTIKPDESYNYSGECSGWVLADANFHDFHPHDGVDSEYFKPEESFLKDGNSWTKTPYISLQDDICFVAEWTDTDGDGIYDGEDNCIDDINPDQEDTDGDGIGDVCDKPDIVLYMFYDNPKYTTTELQDGKTRLTFNISSYLANEGTEPVSAGEEVVITWSQEVIKMGSGNNAQNNQQQTNAVLKVAHIITNTGKVKLRYALRAVNQNQNQNVQAMQITENFNPLVYRHQVLNLAAGLLQDANIQLDDQQFAVTVDSLDDCVLVSHTANAEDNLAEELNEDNVATSEAYNTLQNCYGVLEVDFDAVISDIVGKDPVLNPGLDKDLQGQITKAGMNKLIEIYNTVGEYGNPAHEQFMVRYVYKGEQLKNVVATPYNNRPAFSITKNKHTTFMGFLPMEMPVETVVDAETEEVVVENKPWWSFLTSG